jgi:SAM-dependent methyltransferase
MTDITAKVRENYSAANLTERIKEELARLAPESERLTVAQLASFDQFHIRGALATAELASAAGLGPSTRVLDLGSGVGGPARYLAVTFGCQVTGVDLSPDLVDAAIYLTARCGLSNRVTFQIGDALNPPFENAAFDAVFLQHVAMNIEDRAALYRQVHRILAPGARLATYDVVCRDGDVLYPTPWAGDASTSFLLSESETRNALEQAGFQAIIWRDDTQTALDWLKAAMGGPPPSGPNLGLLMGPAFQAKIANVARNIRENRLGVLFAVLTRK